MIVVSFKAYFTAWSRFDENLLGGAATATSKGRDSLCDR